MSKISFVATGDSLITRRLPGQDEDFRRLAELIGQAQVRFTNLETVIRRSEGFPSAQSGGTWTSAPPEVLEDLRAYGFNLVNWATNHTLDYSYGGLEATARYLQEYGFIAAGAGADLAEASEPKYVECSGGRVALIAATASFHESWMAGAQRYDMVGRPGINPLRHRTIYRISAEKMENLKAIAAVSRINAARELSVKNGFQTPDEEGVFRFGQHVFTLATPDEPEGEYTSPDPRDLKRMFRMIDEAKRQSDVVLISLHAHEFKGGDNDLPADFLRQFARACIDRGAHAFLGHGPHLVRGIEIYKNRPIFYSLGNFIFQSDTVTHLPSDYYEKYGLGPEHTTSDALDARSHGDTRGYAANPKIWTSIVPVWEMENGELTALTLYPISLGFGLPRYLRGWPKLTDDVTVLEHINRLSAEFGTRFEIRDGRAHWIPAGR
ncbi:MAG: CapA family protein [Firmicutes bacterium]|nr:CapA family protein [Bacillota bacterium]